MYFINFLALGLASLPSGLSAPCGPTVDRGNLTVALVRQPPPNWPMPIENGDYRGLLPNMSEAVSAGISLIETAKARGADVIAFPELWFPGHPKGSIDDDYFRQTYLPQYAESAMVVGDDNWNTLVSAIQQAGIYAQLNFAEVDGDSMFMSQALISPIGDILAHRRKLRPSGGERYMFSDGTLDGIKVIDTAYGRWGMLECYENFWPSMTFNTHVQQEALHFSPYPFLQEADDPTAPWFAKDIVNQGVMSAYSIQGQTWSLTPSIGSTFIHNPEGIMVAHIGSSVSYDEHPILYHDIDASELGKKKAYDVNDQYSWDTLQQIVDGFPGYVPKIGGKLVPSRSVSVKNTIMPGKVQSND